MRTSQLLHKGKTIYFMDFSNLSDIEEIKKVITDGTRFIRSQPAVSIMTLTQITGMHFNDAIKSLFQDFIKGNKPHVKAGAVVGLSGLQTILYNGLMKITGRNIKSFSNLESAKDWLVIQ